MCSRGWSAMVEGKKPVHLEVDLCRLGWIGHEEFPGSCFVISTARNAAGDCFVSF